MSDLVGSGREGDPVRDVRDEPHGSIPSVGQSETSGEDRRRVTVEVAWVPSPPSDPAPAHRWQAEVFVGDERVMCVRCFTRDTAVDEAVGALAVAKVWVDDDE